MITPITSLKEIAWPAIPSVMAATKLAIQYQLDESQWWSLDELQKYQLQQFKLVYKHAVDTVPFYKDLYSQYDLPPIETLTFKQFQTLPFINRILVQSAADEMLSTNIPVSHGKLSNKTTSGSTGVSLQLKGTEIGGVLFAAHTLRDHLWHKRDLTKTFASIRLTHDENTNPPNGIRYPAWGMSTGGIYNTGSSRVLSIQSSIDEQWEWLKKINPEYLLVYPSSLKGILERSKSEPAALSNLIEVSTLAEVVTDELRDMVKSLWNVPLKDMYSSVEIGYMALQCPDHEHYHIQSESMILEVLDENNNPCKAGDIGRVVITTLHNFATPLIRYEIGDYAMVGAPCPCGRGLPVLSKIMGRERNLVTLPNGEKRWVWVGDDIYGGNLPITKFQMIQHTVEDIEIKLVCDPILDKAQESLLFEKLIETMSYSFNFRLNYVDDIPRSKGGKFEDFISLLK